MAARVTRRNLLTGSAAALSVAFLSGHPARAKFAAHRQPKTHQVSIQGFAFEPAELEIRPGDTIIWTNRDIAPHTATAGDQSWSTPSLNKDQIAAIAVTTDMQTNYYCQFHPMMQANLSFNVDEN